MKGVIFRETLRRSWTHALMLGGTMALMGVYVTAALGNNEMVERMRGIIEGMPFLVNALGGGDAAFLATPAGLFNYGIFSWAILIYVGYGVFAGLAVTAVEEDRGIMDSLLAAPVPRAQVVIEKLLAYTTIVFLSLILGWLGMVASLSASPVFAEVTPTRALVSTLNMLPITLAAICLTAFLSVLVRRRSTAALISGGLVVFSYFIDMVGRSLPGNVQGARAISLFTYYDSTGVMRDGLVAGNVALLVALALLLSGGAVALFQRRDIGL